MPFRNPASAARPHMPNDRKTPQKTRSSAMRLLICFSCVLVLGLGLIAPTAQAQSWGDNPYAPAGNTTSQNLDFLRIHHERLNRIVAWSKQNPLLDAGVTSMIVRREQLPQNLSYDPIVTRVIFYNRVFFGFNRSDLTDKGEEVIRSFSQLLRQEPTAPNILVAGHTDSLGQEAYNASLSEKRAKAVSYRLNDNGLPLNRMRLIAMGEIQPLGSNQTKNGQATNRRVEFFISNSEAANEIAAQSVKFDPCHRNNHPNAKTAEICQAGQTQISIRQLLPGGQTGNTGRSLNFAQ